MSYEIAQPSEPDRFDKEKNLGRLILFVDITREDGVHTGFGEADAARCRLVVTLDGPDAPDVIDDQRFFGNLGQILRRKGDRILLGRLGRGEARNGNSAPWIINKYTDDDLEIAKKWLATEDTPKDDPSPDEPKDPDPSPDDGPY
jgi:hypothetical protein